MLIHLIDQKVIGIQRHYVKPRIADVKHDFLSNECKNETDLSEIIVKNGLYLESILDDVYLNDTRLQFWLIFVNF